MNHTFHIVIIAFVAFTLSITACNRKSSPSVNQEQPTAAAKNKSKLEIAEPEAPVDKANDRVEIGDQIQTTPLRSPFQEEPDTVFLIRRTACYGNCPQYTALLLSDGKALYHGKRNVDKIGSYLSQVNKRKVFELDGRIQKAKFFEFADAYPENGERIVDASNTILFSEYQSKRKKIDINHDAPAELIQLIDFMDSFFDGLEWQSANSVEK